LSEENQKNNPNTVYDLIANLVHDGDPNKGTYRVHILNKTRATWYEMQDLHVIDVLPQMITLSEAYIQVTLFMLIDKTIILKYNIFFKKDLGTKNKRKCIM
jgi:U4/U6.U5 tri-snRNP-associated protein 2